VFGAQIGPKQVIPAPTPGSTAPPPPPIHVYEGIQVRGKQPIITQTIAIAPSPSMGPGALQNPMSPILKAQLSAPPKPQSGAASTSGAPGPAGPQQGSQSPLPGASNTARTKAHPHLSQALLGSGNAGSVPSPATSSSASLTASPTSSTSDPSSSTSLIKSLLANKVGPEPPTVLATSGSGVPVSVCANLNNPTSQQQQQPALIGNTVVASQVTQRQQQAQKMLSQSPAPSPSTSSIGSTPPTGALASSTNTNLSSGIIKSTGSGTAGTQMRLNGVTINMQQVTNHIVENSLDPKPSASPSAATPSSSSCSTDPSVPPSSPSQPCPPLAPLTLSNKSPTSSTVQSGSGTSESLQAASASLVDGTSVVVNGGISNSINSAGDISDQTYKENIAKQSLMLVDLLEKSISDKDPPTINGAIRIGEKGLDLFTSIDSKTKLSQQAQSNTTTPGVGMPNNTTPAPVTLNVNNSSGVIRRVSTELEAHNNINSSKANGTTNNSTTLPAVKQNGADQQVVGMKRPRPHEMRDANDQPAVKKVHVNGDINLPAAEEQDENNVKASSTAANLYAALAADVLEDEDITDVTAAQQQPTQPPQQPPQPVPIQPAPGQNIIMTAGGGGPASGPGGGGRQQILVTGGTGGLPQRLQMMGQHYVVTQQPQLVQGHSGQTVLVAQTGQQGGPGSKTIIILQPSSSASPSPTNIPSNKTIVTSIPPSTTITTNTNQKVIVSVPPLGGPAPGTPTTPGQTSVVHRTPIRPQPGGISSSNSPSATTVIKQVPDTRPPRPPSGFQQQFLQSQKLLQQTSSPSPSPQQKSQQQHPPPGQFICEWRGCMRNFKSANEVYMHACECHCPVTPTQEIQCLWERCDAMRRKRFSHMTHLYDRHCNPDVLKMMAVRRKQLSLSGKTEIPPPPAPAPHPGYAPNAAFNAIKRHALEFVNPKELQDENEGPVTKSIRLTSSLILRNLVIYSNTCRRHLITHEPHLASVALSNVESSKTIAQVLFDMNHTQPR
ncbi:hypothetical protein WDU94_011820, partial [Cyamophila willieti]